MKGTEQCMKKKWGKIKSKERKMSAVESRFGSERK